jgi:hypothetical protein
LGFFWDLRFGIDLGFGIWVLGFIVVLAPACGKKGPPLAPIVRIPAAVDTLKPERSGSDVYVTLTVPSQNIDKSKPADVARVDVYAVTATTAPVRGQFLAQASRIAVVPIIPVHDDGSVVAREDGQPQVGGSQGTTITVHEALTSVQFTPVTPPAPASRGTRPPSSESNTTDAASSGPPLPQRFYMAIAFSQRGRPGPEGTVAPVPLSWAPPPPPNVVAVQSGENVNVSWDASGGVLGFILDRSVPVEPPPFEDIRLPPPSGPLASDVPPGPTRYNVYRQDSADPLSLPAAAADPWQQTRPTPINPEPLMSFSLTEPAEFGRTRCYSIRAVRGGESAQAPQVEGDASKPECVTPVDTIPPAAPTNLVSTPGEGTITLIWDANAELDLGGYVVLRGEAGGDTLQPLTESPITEPRFTDRTAVPGKRYVYAVVAVDDRVPVPNRSAESNHVEDAAR